MCYAKVTMATKPPIASSLNPNAPVFVPAAYLAAEDFSPEWWRLIQTSTSFREWWMKERFVSDENEQAAVATAARDGNEFDDIDELLELGFQTGILDDLEDQPAPVVPQQQYRQYPQQQQQQHPQLPLVPNEHVNLLITPPYSLQKLRSHEAAGGAGFQNGMGTVFKEGKPQ